MYFQYVRRNGGQGETSDGHAELTVNLANAKYQAEQKQWLTRGLAHAESKAYQSILALLDAAQAEEQLTLAVKQIWRAHSGKLLTDDEATRLNDIAQGRRAHRRPMAGAAHSGKADKRLFSRFRTRTPQRSPDRQKSRERRRTLGGSSALPPELRGHYTEGHRAVLCIVSEAIKQHGLCDYPLDKIAAMAGVCRTTVQNALHEARLLRHVTIEERPLRGRKNLTNIVRIVCREWLDWIKRSFKAASRIGSKAVKTVSPTKTLIYNNRKTTPHTPAITPVERPKLALEGRLGAILSHMAELRKAGV